MADAYTPTSHLRGVLVHDERISTATLDTTRTTATEAGPLPDTPVPNALGFLELEALGVYTDETDVVTYNVACKKPGAPTIGTPGGSLVYRRSASATWLGWHAPNVITGVSVPVSSTGAVTAGVVPGGAVTLASGKVVHVYEDRTTSPDRVKCHTRNPDTTAWSSAVTVRELVQDSDVNEYAVPTLVVLPAGTRTAGRLLCFYLMTDETDATSHGISMSYSDDEGATWTTGGDLLWTRAITGNIYSMKAVYSRGYITLLLSTSIAGHHLVSDDLGCSWTDVENPTGSYYAPAVTPSGEVLLFRGEDVLRKAGPFEPFSESSTVFDTVEATATGNVAAAVVDDAGIAWVVRHKTGGTSTYEDELYLDALDTQTMTRLEWDRTDNASTGNPVHPLAFPGVSAAASSFDLGGANWALCKYGAGLLLIAPADGANSTFTTDYSASLWAIELGGYDSLAWKSRAFGRYGSANLSGCFYLPIDTPDALGWTSAGAGTRTVSAITDGDFTGLACAITQTRSFYAAGVAGKGLIVSGRVRCDESTAFTVLRVERDDGAAYNYRAEVRLGNGTIVLRNANGAANLATANIDTTKVWDVKVFVAGTKAALYYKHPTDRTWIEVGKGTLTNLGASAVATSRTTFGCLDGGAADVADWLYVGASMHNHDKATGFTSSDPDLESLHGFPVTPFARGLYLDNGIRLRGRGGTVFNADSWSVPPRYQYPVEACLWDANRSPSTGWRSSTTAEQSIAFDLEAAGQSLLSSTIAVALVGINFRTAYLEYSTNGSAWTTAITFDAAASMGTTIGYAVSGGTAAGRVLPSSGTAAGGLTVEADELVDGTVLLTDTVAADVYATIVRNSEGAWRAPASSRAIELRVEPRSGDDLALLTSPDTCEVWYPGGVEVLHNFSGSPRYWRLRIASQTTATGDFRIGALVIGGVIVFGKQNSWGRRLTLDTNVDRVEDEAGRRFTRRRGPERRGVEVSWVDPFDTTELYATSPDPTYVRARNNASYRGIAMRGDASVAEAIVRRSRSGELPVVYLPAIPIATSGSDEFGLYGRARWLYGEVVGGVSRTSILGDEASSEVLAVDALRIEELV